LLREQRKRAGVGLRRVAGRSAWSVSAGHLSRVERGERPVTPAIVAVYEQALGIRIADAVADPTWLAGHPDPRPEAFTSTIGKVAAGGGLIEPVERLLEPAAAGPVAVPARAGHPEVAHVEQAAALVRQLDQRFGGALACQMAGGLLRWAVGLQEASMADPVRARLHAATGALAAWAGWAAFDDGRQRTARTLFTMALHAAVRADDADLRAHILADVAAHYSYLSYPDQCLTILRLEGDERVGPAVRSVLHGVRAYAYAAKQDPAACAREIESAEAAGAAVAPGALPAWLDGFEEPHTQAVCGHAAAILARGSGQEAHRADAYKRLSYAVESLDPSRRARAVALCQTRLAMLHLADGEVPEAAQWARRALAATVDLRSVRVRRDLAAIAQAAATRPDHPVARELAGQVQRVVKPSARPPS
jgi:transcriptional regulator with XRE-family HTH domain